MVIMSMSIPDAGAISFYEIYAFNRGKMKISKNGVPVILCHVIDIPKPNSLILKICMTHRGGAECAEK
jgi:hypothetical protein